LDFFFESRRDNRDITTEKQYKKLEPIPTEMKTNSRQEYSKKYYENNKEKLKERSRLYYEKNREKLMNFENKDKEIQNV
jgi:hypothetical protein